MLSSAALTHDDLHDIGRPTYRPEDPAGVAAELAEAVEQGRLADPADSGFALVVAAEVAERAGDLNAALGFAERSAAAYLAQGRTGDGYPRALRAGLLMRTGRRDEGLAVLTALRPLLVDDLDAADYITDALVASDETELAVEWLTEALDEAARTRAALDPVISESGSASSAMVAFNLLRNRQRLRRDLGQAPDAYDDLAETMLTAIANEVGAAAAQNRGRLGTAFLFWPPAELDQLLERWPALADSYESDWDAYRGSTERVLTSWSESGNTKLGLIAGSVA